MIYSHYKQNVAHASLSNLCKAKAYSLRHSIPMPQKSIIKLFQPRNILMKIFNTIQDWRTARVLHDERTSIGLVTTMGNLHVGHLALIQQSLNENQKTVVTLFVNPTQFSQADDFEKYPRTLDADIALLQAA